MTVVASLRRLVVISAMAVTVQARPVLHSMAASANIGEWLVFDEECSRRVDHCAQSVDSGGYRTVGGYSNRLREMCREMEVCGGGREIIGHSGVVMVTDNEAQTTSGGLHMLGHATVLLLYDSNIRDGDECTVLASPFSRDSVPRAFDKIMMELNNRAAFINNGWDEVVALENRQLTLFCDFEPRAMADLRLSVPSRRAQSYGQYRKFRSIVP